MGRVARSEHGQGSLEGLGIIVVAALLVGGAVHAVSSSSDPVRQAVSAGICRVTSLGGGGECEEVEPVPAEPTQQETVDVRTPVCVPVGQTAAGNESPIGIGYEHEIPVGWPVEVDGTWRFGDVPGTSGTGAQSNIVVGGSVELGESTPDENGINWTDLSYELTAEYVNQVSGELAAQGINVAVEAETLAGLSSGASLTVPASYLEDGVPQTGLPNPLDPLSIPPGATMTLDAGAYLAAGMSGSLNMLRTSLQYGTSEEISVAITPLGDGQVQVTYGSTAAIEQAASLGVGIEEVNVALTQNTSLGDFQLQQVTFDVDEVDGHSAYLALLNGQTPSPESVGVVDQAQISGGEYSMTHGFQLNAGGVQMSNQFYSSDLTTSVSESADGSSVVTMTQVLNGQVRTYVETFDAEGVLVDTQSDVRLSNVSGEEATGYNQLFAGDGSVEVDGDVNLVLDLAPEDLEQIRQDAIDLALHGLNDTYTGQELAAGYLDAAGSVSEAELMEWLETADPEEVEYVMSYALGGSGSDFTSRALSNVLGSMAANGDDDWSTYAAFTDALDLEGAAAPTYLMYWGQQVAEVTGEPYTGFGDATCVSVT